MPGGGHFRLAADEGVRRAQLAQARRDAANREAKYNAFVLTAADALAAQAGRHVTQAAAAGHAAALTPELLSLQDLAVQLPMPTWRHAARHSQLYDVTAEHVQRRQGIAERMHYTSMAAGRGMVSPAIQPGAAGDDSSRCKPAKAKTKTKKGGLRRPRKQVGKKRRRRGVGSAVRRRRRRRPGQVAATSCTADTPAAPSDSQGAVTPPTDTGATQSCAQDALQDAADSTCPGGGPAPSEEVAAAGLHSVSEAAAPDAAASVFQAALEDPAPEAGEGGAPPPSTPPRQHSGSATCRTSPASAATGTTSGRSSAVRSGKGARASPSRKPAPTPFQAAQAARVSQSRHLRQRQANAKRQVSGAFAGAHAEAAVGGVALRKQGRRGGRRARGGGVPHGKAFASVAPAVRGGVSAAPPPPPAQASGKVAHPPPHTPSCEDSTPHPVSLWEGSIPSQYPLLWGGTRKGLSRWPTLGAGEALSGVLGTLAQEWLQPETQAGSKAPLPPSTLRRHANQRAEAKRGPGSNAPPRLHGAGSVRGEEAHPLTGQAVLPPTVLTQLTAKQRLRLGKGAVKNAPTPTGGTSAVPQAAAGLFTRQSPPRPRHPFDASWGGVMPSPQQVRARDAHADSCNAALQARRQWLMRRPAGTPWVDPWEC